MPCNFRVTRLHVTLAAMLACTACAPPTVQHTAAREGAILSRAPCQIDVDPHAFSAALDSYYRADIVKAGLEAELAARPLLGSFTQRENVQLADAAKAGRCERIMYNSSGLRVAGFLLRPATPGPHPVLIWLRGGNREYGKIGQVTLLNLQYLANAGFVVLAPQYRGVDGGEGKDEFGGADVDDVLALVPLARRLPGADLGRLYLLGGSRGAMQGTIAMRHGLPVRAAAFRGGVFDLTRLLADRPELGPEWQVMMPDFAGGNGAALVRRSAVAWAGELRAPTLFLHGRQDWRSRVDNSQAFAALLDKAGVSTKVIVYEREEHQLALHRPQWLAETVSWFRQHGAFDPVTEEQSQTVSHHQKFGVRPLGHKFVPARN